MKSGPATSRPGTHPVYGPDAQSPHASARPMQRTPALAWLLASTQSPQPRTAMGRSSQTAPLVLHPMPQAPVRTPARPVSPRWHCARRDATGSRFRAPARPHCAISWHAQHELVDGTVPRACASSAPHRTEAPHDARSRRCKGFRTVWAPLPHSAKAGAVRRAAPLPLGVGSRAPPSGAKDRYRTHFVSPDPGPAVRGLRCPHFAARLLHQLACHAVHPASAPRKAQVTPLAQRRQRRGSWPHPLRVPSPAQA